MKKSIKFIMRIAVLLTAVGCLSGCFIQSPCTIRRMRIRSWQKEHGLQFGRLRIVG